MRKIKDSSIIYDGIVWSLHDGYYDNTINGKLHRYIWEQYNGPIPTGFVIHHKDEDKLNYSIENLIMMTVAEHISHHHKNKVVSKKTCIKISEAHKGMKTYDRDDTHKLLMSKKKTKYKEGDVWKNCNGWYTKVNGKIKYIKKSEVICQEKR
jgi:hypothetical protein